MAKKAAKKETSAAKKAAPSAKKVGKVEKKETKAIAKASTKAKLEKPAVVVKEKSTEPLVPKKTKAEKLAASEDEARWHELYEKHKDDKPQTYDMRAAFESGKALQHKILGWGWILSNENDRLEVLFKDGKRILISNYNPR